MRQFIFFTALILSICFSDFAEAQVVDRTKNRAKNKANNRVDRKIDQGIDKGLDSIEGIFKKKNKKDKGDKGEEKENTDASSDQKKESQAEEDAAAAEMMSKMMGGADVDLPESYNFDHQVDMRYTTYNKKGKSEGSQEMEMLFSDDAGYFGVRANMEGQNSITVFDMGEKMMVMLMDMGAQKMAMTMSFDPENYDFDDEEESEMSSSFRKTGRTKNILGYTCDEYVMEDEEANYEFWVSQEEEFGVFQAFSAMSEADKSRSKSGLKEYPIGMTMEMTSTNKKNGEKMMMEVTNVSKNKKQSVSTKGYSQMSMGGRK